MECFCELSSVEFEKSIIKNSFICSMESEWVWFIDSTVTCRTDIEHVLQENIFLLEYEAIIFCSAEWSGEVSVLDLLKEPKCVIYAFGVKKQLLKKTGSFNTLLEGNTNYEFLLRVAEMGSVYAISCSAEKEYIFNPYAMAYIVRRYMVYLKEIGWLDYVFMRMTNLAENEKKTAEFNQTMNIFLAASNEYDNIAQNTAPFLVFVGNNTCSGVLAGFARTLADELVSLGQSVITTDGRYGDYDNISTEKLLSQSYRAIIGFQTPIFSKSILSEVKGKKIQFWFDNPIFSKDIFMKHIKDSYILCQDEYYADYIRRHFGIPNAIQFPPGGTVINDLPTEKIYDVTFVGNYEPISECVYEDAFESGFFEYMCTQVDVSFEQGMREYLSVQDILFEETELPEYLRKVRRVCQDILHLERHVMIERIVSNGIKLHVFSENWNMYQGNGKENLIIHPMIYGEEPYRVWAQSKIGLNIMRGHKAGMTERIANIMLCGTCCLSDETEYLREYFVDGEDIVLFKRTELEELPKKIQYLLDNEEERERIAVAGCKKAFSKHTWSVRAKQLMELIN